MKLIKIPFSGGGLGHGNGANEAPGIIIEQLREMFANEEGKNFVYDISEVTVNENNIGESHQAITNYFQNNKNKAIILGGDHSITQPVLKGLGLDVQFIVFDAHPDVMDDFRPPTQEDYLRVLIEEGSVKAKDVMILGVRNWDEKEVDYLRSKGVTYYTMSDIFEKGVKSIMSEVKAWIKKDAYLSLDIDVVDPVEAIGTGYLEHGGMSSRELIYCIQQLKKHVRMADIVEVNPKKDIKNMTSKLAAKLIVELS